MSNHISFAEPEKLSEIFDSANREEWQNTSYILNNLNLKPNTRIADVGAGTGYFARQFAQLAPEGKVYAIDTEANMVGYMQNRFANEGLVNIETRQNKHDDPCLPKYLDMVFMANVYRFIQERPTFLARLHAQIHQETEVIFVDFRGINARISAQQAMDEVRAAGFQVKSVDLESCPDHYIMKFSKAFVA